MTVTVKWYGPRVKRRMHAGAVQGLREASEHVLEVSNRRVPIEEGTLERSGVASVDESALKAAVSYDTPYAARQHEELTWHHDEGREAKFLEKSLHQERPTVLRILQKNLKRKLGG